ncbi:MAG TPA: hypothetical protein VJX69_02605 [Terriglobales bacterium]|nr:hypothetical protein [Terriglobales bacterium]
MSAKSFHQFVGRVIWNLATSLAPADRGPELDLRQRQDGESMPCVAGGEAKKSIRARLIHVKLNEGTRF